MSNGVNYGSISPFNFCIIIFLSLILLVGCYSKTSNDDTFKSLETGLNKSIESTNSQSHLLYSAFKERLSDRHYVENAKIWYPKAVSVKLHSDDMFAYIANIKERLI